jgi:hypothetical protein
VRNLKLLLSNGKHTNSPRGNCFRRPTAQFLPSFFFEIFHQWGEGDSRVGVFRCGLCPVADTRTVLPQPQAGAVRNSELIASTQGIGSWIVQFGNRLSARLLFGAFTGCRTRAPLPVDGDLQNSAAIHEGSDSCECPKCCKGVVRSMQNFAH